MNTSFFILPLFPILLIKAWRNPEELRAWRQEIETWLRGRYQRLKQKHSEDTEHTEYMEDDPMSASQELLLGPPSHVASAYISSSPAAPLTLLETLDLSWKFCILWFIANYFVIACLEFTTVASSTILTSTASVFTLVFGALAGVEKFTLRKLLGVLASLMGVILISSIDFSGKSSDDKHRGHFPQKTYREMAVGDAFAVLSALLYGLYAVFMKKRIADDGRVSIPLFLGLVGLLNVVLLWPGFFILHWTGIEEFSLPSGGRVILILVCNAMGSTLSDLAWAYAVLLNQEY